MRTRRFTDVDKWHDRWLQNLDQDHILLWLYICDVCDYSGCWKVNLRDAAYFTHAKNQFDAKVALKLFNQNEQGFDDDRPRVIPIADGKKWWIRGFIFFHFAKTDTGRLLLNAQSALHARVIGDLDHNGVREIFLKYYPGAITNAPLVQHRAIPMPTLDEIRALPNAKNLSDAEIRKFWGYWQGLGWKRGDVLIQDFSALLVEWMARDECRKEEQAAQTEQASVDKAALRLEMESLIQKIVACRKDTELLAGFKVPSIRPEANERMQEHKLKLDQVKAQLRQLGERV